MLRSRNLSFITIINFRWFSVRIQRKRLLEISRANVFLSNWEENIVNIGLIFGLIEHIFLKPFERMRVYDPRKEAYTPQGAHGGTGFDTALPSAVRSGPVRYDYDHRWAVGNTIFALVYSEPFASAFNTCCCASRYKFQNIVDHTQTTFLYNSLMHTDRKMIIMNNRPSHTSTLRRLPLYLLRIKRAWEKTAVRAVRAIDWFATSEADSLETIANIFHSNCSKIKIFNQLSSW